MITQTVCLFIAFIAILILILGLAFVGIKCEQLEHRIENFESSFERQRNMFKLNSEHIKNIYNNFSECSEGIEKLKKDLSVLEGIQSKMDIELSKMNILDSRIHSLEFIINSLHSVNSKLIVTDKPDPLNPSGIMYNTNTTELKR